MSNTTATDERLFHLMWKQAKDEWGSGWDRLGLQLQRALIAEQVLLIATMQDEDSPAETVRRIVEYSREQLFTRNSF